MTPRALIITTTGINCDRELAEAFELAGAEPVSMHLNHLIEQPSCIDAFDLIGLPGGFSYGDAVAAGRIASQVMRSGIYDALQRALQRGVPMIAPCNGFQIAVQVGLLPGPADEAPAFVEPPKPTVALADNDSARFIDRWVRIEIPVGTRCVWTKGLVMEAGTDLLPIAHGEGRFVASPEEFARLEETGCIAVRYASDDNPNGSLGDVAGICDRSGLVFGLMPHPERYTRWTSHPIWTRLDAGSMKIDPPGLRMFRNAVDHVRALASDSAACDVR